MELYVVFANGEYVQTYTNKEKAYSHVYFQWELGSRKKWSVMHIKDYEWLKP